MVWQNAPLVEEPPEQEAWMQAPLVEEDVPVQREATAAPTPQQPVKKKPAEPLEMPQQVVEAPPPPIRVNVEGTYYSFPAGTPPERMKRALQKEFSDRRELSEEQLGGRSQWVDSEEHARLRQNRPITEVGQAEYAELFSSDYTDEEGNPLTLEPSDITPQLLEKAIADRKETVFPENVDPATLREFNEDTAAMEMDRYRLFPNETSLEYKQRMAVVKGEDPSKEVPEPSLEARDLAIHKTRPAYKAAEWLRERGARFAENQNPDIDEGLRKFKENFPDVPMDKETISSVLEAYRDANLIVGGFGGGEAEGLAMATAPDRRQEVVFAVKDLAKRRETRDRRGLVVRTGESFIRGGVEANRWARKKLPEFISGADLTDEEEIFRQQLTNAYDAGDPLVPEDDPWYKRGMIQAAGMVVPMAESIRLGGALGVASRSAMAGKAAGHATAVLETGTAGAYRAATAGAKVAQGAQRIGQAAGVGGAYLPSMTTNSYHSMIAEGIDPSIAKVAAPISGILQAALETIQIDPTGVLLKSAKTKILDTTARIVGRNLLKRPLKEWSEEFAQGIADEVTKETARWFDEEVPQKGYGNAVKEGVQQGLDAGPALLFLMGPGAVVSTTLDVAELRQMREKGFVSEIDGERILANSSGLSKEDVATRKTRKAVLDELIQEKEIEDASAIQRTEEEVRETESGEDLREPGEVEEVAEPTSKKPEAPEVPVEPTPLPTEDKKSKGVKEEAPAPEVAQEGEFGGVSVVLDDKVAKGGAHFNPNDRTIHIHPDSANDTKILLHEWLHSVWDGVPDDQQQAAHDTGKLPHVKEWMWDENVYGIRIGNLGGEEIVAAGIEQQSIGNDIPIEVANVISDLKLELPKPPVSEDTTTETTEAPRDYEDLKGPRLYAEIKKRNEGRKPEDKLKTRGKVADLRQSLMEDDAAQAETKAVKARPATRIKEHAKSLNVDPEVYLEEANKVHQGRLEGWERERQAKKDAWKATGLTSQDARRLNNKGFDYSSASTDEGIARLKSAGFSDSTIAKLKQFDTKTRQLATDYPDLFELEASGEAAKGASDSIWELLSTSAKDLDARKPRLDDPEVFETVDQQAIDDAVAGELEAIPPQKRSEVKANEAEVLREQLRDIGRRLIDPTDMSMSLNVNKARQAAEFVTTAVKLGVTEFDHYVSLAVETLGEKAVRDWAPYLESAWKHAGPTDAGKVADVLGKPPEEAPPAPTTPPQDVPPLRSRGRETGVKNVMSAQLREEAGFGERVPPTRETVEQWEAEATRRHNEDPLYRMRLARDVLEGGRTKDPADQRALGQYIAQLQAERRAGEDNLDELLLAIEASEKSGTEPARILRARQENLDEEGAIIPIVRQHLDAVGEPPTAEQAAKYDEMAERIDKLQAEVDASQQKLAMEEIRRRIAEAKAAQQKKPTAPPKVGTKRERKVKQKNDAIKSFKDAWEDAVKAGGVSLTTGGLDPKAVAAVAKMTKAAAGVVKAYAELGIDSALEFMNQVKKDFGKLSAEQAEIFKKAWNDAKGKGTVDTPLGENPEKTAIGVRARKLMKQAVEAGIEGREDVIDAVHEVLSEEVPDISRSETMEAMSGYGDFRELPKDEVSVKVRGYRGEIQQLLKLEEMQAGQAPRKTGVERREPTDEERRLIKLVNEAKKRGGYEVTDPARQLTSALNTAKTAIRNRIADLEKEIAAKEKIVKDRTSLEPDAELTALREKRDELLAEHKKIFPPKKSPLSDAQRLKMAKALLDRQIAEMESDLAAGRLGPKTNQDPVTDEELESKKSQLALWREVRESARKASPEYQAQEEAKRTARYKKSLERQLAFWEKREEEASKGILPKKPKPTPVDDEIREKKWEIEKVRREAQAAVENARRAYRTPGQVFLGGVADVIDLSTLLRTGYEMSGTLRQGAVYSLGYPRQALPALVKSMHAFISREADFSHHDTLMERENRHEYREGGLNLTVAEGPMSQREELMRSRIVSWVSQQEGALWAAPRWAAEGALGSERAFRTFLNTMAADMYDNMKDRVESTRPGTWSEDDVAFFGSAANTFRGRPHIPHADALRFVLWAPRWVWSGVQLFTTLPVRTFARGVDVKTPSTIWKGDKATRKAIAEVYVRSTIGAAAYYMLMHGIYSLLAGDDDEHKPKYEIDMRSTKFGRRQVGETTFETSRGLTQFATLIARAYTGETKTASGEIVPLYGDDAHYGSDDIRDILHRYLDYKLSNVAGGVLDFIARENAVGEQLSPNALVRAGQVTGERFLPMSWIDIYEAEKELNVPQGTVAALEVFFGESASTYGPRTKYREAKPEKRKELFGKFLDNMEWNSPQPAYSEMLTADQMKQVDERREEKKQDAIHAITPEEPDRKKHKNDETYATSLKEREAAMERMRELAATVTHEEAIQLLEDYYERTRGPKKKHYNTATKKRGDTLPSYQRGKKLLKQLYAQ